MWFVGTDLNSCLFVLGFFGFETTTLKEAAVLPVAGEGLSGFAGELVFRSLHHIIMEREGKNIRSKKKKDWVVFMSES